MFNDSIGNSFTLPFDSWTTDRKSVHTGKKCQLDIGSAHSFNSPKLLIAARQTEPRPGRANRANIMTVLAKVSVKKFFVKTDRVRYPEGSFNIVYDINQYFDVYRDLYFYYKESVGEPLLSLFETYPVSKTFYTFQVIDLEFQVDHIEF